MSTLLFIVKTENIIMPYELIVQMLVEFMHEVWRESHPSVKIVRLWITGEMMQLWITDGI